MHDTATVRAEIRALLASTLSLPESEIEDDISQDTTARWTSLNHMMLLVAIEEQFGVQLSMQEMVSMTTLPKIVAVLNKRS